jgi:hypothetical protein
MRFTRSFVTVSWCPKRLIAVSMDVLRRSFVFYAVRCGLNRSHVPPRVPETARRSNGPACHADVITSFYFLDALRKSASVRRNISRGKWLSDRFAMRKIGYATTTPKTSLGERDCKVSAINASTSRRTGTRKRSKGASAAIMT